MDGILGPRRTATSYNSPLAGHVSHLRHLSKPKTAELVLRGRFGYARPAAKEIAKLMAPFVEQAVEFHDASRLAQLRIRPVLQYYGYLNLAVACVIAHRPTNYLQYKSHGGTDLTPKLKMLDLRSPVVQVRHGAIPLFHSIISDCDINKRIFRLRELFASIPVLSLELEDAFGVPMVHVECAERLFHNSDTPKRMISELDFRLSRHGAGDLKGHRLPRSRLEQALPFLRTEYLCSAKRDLHLNYKSVTNWDEADHVQAMTWHNVRAFKAMNFGARSLDDGIAHHIWYTVPRAPILPALTASLLLSFVLASVARYRPNLTAQLEDSRLNIVVDVFTAESDCFVIPALRNLLYKEELSLETIGYL